jgi:CRISPR/Cas system Type II protein with McrA/HNH and RuvC-like nuclease domain
LELEPGILKRIRRTKQDFYILWYLLAQLNYQMVKFHRLEIKKDLQDIFYALRNNFSKESFLSQVQDFHTKYSVEKRQTKLSETEKLEMLKEQGNICPISGAPIFIGDEIEVDHTMPLAIGGADSKENFQIVHKDSNRSKGAKPPSE